MLITRSGWRLVTPVARKFELLISGQHNGYSVVLVQRVHRYVNETFPHCHFGYVLVTMACGLSACRSLMAVSMSSWSRPSTVAALHPSISNRDATRPTMRRRLVVDHYDDQVTEAQSCSNFHRLLIASLVELSITKEAEHSTPGFCELKPMSQPHGNRESVAQWATADLNSRHQGSVRVLPQYGIVATKIRKLINGEEAFCGQNSVVGYWA